jgi:hypothetical protein
MAAQPPSAVPSASHDPPGPEPRTKQPANSQEASAAPSHASAQATGAQLVKTLREFALSTLSGIEHANDELVADRFAGDLATIVAAAERGDGQAQLYMLRRSCACRDELKRWARIMTTQGNTDEIIWMGLYFVQAYLAAEKNGPERDAMKYLLQNQADRGSATAQYALGMLIYCSQCNSGAVKFLAARGGRGSTSRWLKSPSQPAPRAGSSAGGLLVAVIARAWRGEGHLSCARPPSPFAFGR